MSSPEGARCTVRYADGPCPNGAASGLPICGACLSVILNESDPGRRRALATLERLPTGLLLRLIDDPDEGVRARVAIRDDLDAGTIARFADPDRENSPIVWRAVASTPSGAAHAESLLETGDPLTLMVLAANQTTAADMRARLAEHVEVDVARVARAIIEGRPLDADTAQRLLDAQAVPTTPIDTPPDGVSREAIPPPYPSNRTGTSDEPAGDAAGARPSWKVVTLVGGLMLLAALAIVAFVLQGRTPPERTATVPSTVVVSDPTSTEPSTTIAATTTPAPTTQRPTTTAATEPTKDERIALDITVTAQRRRFCGSVKLRIDYPGGTAHAVVTDDADRQLWRGRWPDGATRSVDLEAPTRHLYVHLTSRGDRASFHPSGTVSGGFC